MNRRRFLSLLGLAAATAAVDPDALLWRPGAKTHILPPPQGWRVADPTTGLSMRFVRSFDAAAGPIARLDVFYGMQRITPELACRIMDGPFSIEQISEAAQALADRIDRDARRLYEAAWQQAHGPALHPLSLDREYWNADPVKPLPVKLELEAAMIASPRYMVTVKA